MVDYGGFNLAFLKILKREIKDIKVFYYIPPKLWVWGEWRIRKLKLADEILAIFPWEVEFYKKKNIEAVYFGNPLADLRKEVESFGESILLLPGSRRQEILSLFPVMNKCAEIMKEKKFILKLADRGDLRFISELADNIEVDFDSTLEEICSKCKIAIAASGTVTLELALMGLPSIVVYKTSKINEFIARRIINVKYVSLPNLVKNSEVYKELLQKNMSAENIIKEIVNIEADYENKKKELKDIRERLGGIKIISKYAAYIAERSSND
jgi:lipid-A-disaccharide synthase